MSKQMTQTKLEKLTTFDLFKHHAALSNSLPLLTPDSQELVKAEMELCATFKAEKLDQIYYAWASNEDAIERAKKEEDLLKSQRKHQQIKNLLQYLRSTVLVDGNKLEGKRYQFSFSRLKDLKVEINSNIEDWSQQEQEKYCMLQTVTTTKHTVVTSTKHTVVTSMSGEVLDESTKPVTKTETIPNVDAIRNAYTQGKQLPSGVKVYQNYAIRRKRLLTQRLDSHPSNYPTQLLSELAAATKSGGSTSKNELPQSSC
jgi:histidinol phosphatase-like enzyme